MAGEIESVHHGFGHFILNSLIVQNFVYYCILPFWIEPLFRLYVEKESKSDVLKLTVLICVRMADADDFSSFYYVYSEWMYKNTRFLK